MPEETPPEAAGSTASAGYQVLARKYRPQSFADLIGQEAMVRTLQNAFEQARIHHAFVLTGVRGIGKTTTARIIAKGMNCIGPDGTGGPTITPCEACEHCVAIGAGRHVDVMEMDAASRTGVGDIREIIDAVQYRAASARYKIYIIDEVHMLSTNAFNALLKTLEEPPAHVKFIFATTEIRKIPVTVLSRCQRFDLRRIEPNVMIDFLRGICAKEGASASDDALALITRAAEGSVRDALSLLDQAIAHGAGATGVEEVRAMLGLADRGRIYDLFDLITRGDAAAALHEIADHYAAGGDPLAIMRDLAEVTHALSVIKVSPEMAEDPTTPPDERARGQALASQLSMRVLSRLWQMLLKALEEIAAAPNAMMAAEMAVIRMTHAADLPTPDEIIRQLEGYTPPEPRPPRGSGRPSGTSSSGPTAAGQATRIQSAALPAPSPQPQMQAAPQVGLAAFEDLVALIREKRDMKLLVEVETGLRLVSYRPGRIEFEPAHNAPGDLAQRLSARLHAWTGQRWGISIVSSGGAETLSEQRAKTQGTLTQEVKHHPLIAQALQLFKGATISEIHITPRNEVATGLEDVPDDWDAFDDDDAL